MAIDSMLITTLIVLMVAVIVALVVWVVVAQRREALAREDDLEMFQMAKRHGIEDKLVALRGSGDLDDVLTAMRNCNRCQSHDQCIEFLDNKEASLSAAKGFCPNSQLLSRLQG